MRAVRTRMKPFVFRSIRPRRPMNELPMMTPPPEPTNTSLTPEKPGIPDVVQGRERNDQIINLHVPPGLDGISLVSLSVSRQRRADLLTIYSTIESVSRK
ncbi:hypothetical protein ACTXT7_006683 [Hymenolepis weldensis]